MRNHAKILIVIGIVLILAPGFFPVQAHTLVPLCQAGTAFDATKYPQDTAESDPMTFSCDWNGNGTVYLSGDQYSVSGIYADDGYNVTVQAPATTFDAPEHYAHRHPVVDVTGGMKEGSNNFTIIVKNWMGLSMSYGSKNGIGTDQTPYLVQVVTDPEPKIVPLCPAGTAFDATKYPQDTAESDPMIFSCDWDGNGTVYLSGDQTTITGIYADDGYTVTVQPPVVTFDAPEHYAHQHPVVELTDGMKAGTNNFTIIVKNWMGLSMSYGSKDGIGIDQVPYLMQVTE
jgi:hypothetical protein